MKNLSRWVGEGEEEEKEKEEEEEHRASYAHFVIPGIYIYKEIILQFFIFPTKNCAPNTGKPARKKFSSNFNVSMLLFTTLLMARIGQKLANLCKIFTRKTTLNSIVGHSLSISFAKSTFFEYLTQK